MYRNKKKKKSCLCTIYARCCILHMLWQQRCFPPTMPPTITDNILWICLMACIYISSSLSLFLLSFTIYLYHYIIYSWLNMNMGIIYIFVTAFDKTSFLVFMKHPMFWYKYMGYHYSKTPTNWRFFHFSYFVSFGSLKM